VMGRAQSQKLKCSLTVGAQLKHTLVVLCVRVEGGVLMDV
jgi:hypothetical protein